MRPPRLPRRSSPSFLPYRPILSSVGHGWQSVVCASTIGLRPIPRRNRPRSGVNADRDDGPPGMAPDSGVSADLDGTLAAAMLTQGRKAAVAHHQLDGRAANDGLAAPVAVPSPSVFYGVSAPFVTGALRRGKRRQERHGPHPPSLR